MTNAVLISGKAEGYKKSQCGRTFTVGELIEFLEQFDEDMPVFLINDGGYSYGSITADDIAEDDFADED